MSLRDLLAVALALIMSGGGVIMGILRWSGRRRQWYEHPTVTDSLLNDVFGPNPITLVFLGASILAGLSGILLSWLSLLITEVAVFGLTMPLFVAAIFISLVRPRWALPKWMREVDEGRAARPGNGT